MVQPATQAIHDLHFGEFSCGALALLPRGIGAALSDRETVPVLRRQVEPESGLEVHLQPGKVRAVPNPLSLPIRFTRENEAVLPAAILASWPDDGFADGS